MKKWHVILNVLLGFTVSYGQNYQITVEIKVNKLWTDVYETGGNQEPVWLVWTGLNNNLNPLAPVYSEATCYHRSTSQRNVWFSSELGLPRVFKHTLTVNASSTPTAGVMLMGWEEDNPNNNKCAKNSEDDQQSGPKSVFFSLYGIGGVNAGTWSSVKELKEYRHGIRFQYRWYPTNVDKDRVTRVYQKYNTTSHVMETITQNDLGLITASNLDDYIELEVTDAAKLNAKDPSGIYYEWEYNVDYEKMSLSTCSLAKNACYADAINLCPEDASLVENDCIDIQEELCDEQYNTCINTDIWYPKSGMGNGIIRLDKAFLQSQLGTKDSISLRIRVRKQTPGTPPTSYLQVINLKVLQGPPNELSATPTAPFCYGENTGTIAFDFSGIPVSKYPFTLILKGQSGYIQGKSVSSSSDNTFNYLPEGTYHFVSTKLSTNGAILASAEVTVNGQYQISVPAGKTISPSFSKVDVTCFGATDGIITVSVLNPQFDNYDLLLNSISTQTINGADAYTFTGLPSGDYVVTIIGHVNGDLRSCEVETAEIVISPPTTPLTAEIEQTTAIPCVGWNGVITVTASGGWGNYTYSVNGESFVTENNFTLKAGTHSFKVKDKDGTGCEISAGSMILNDPPSISISVDNTSDYASLSTNYDVSCNGASDGKAEINATGGAAAFTFSWIANDSTFSEVNTISSLDIGVQYYARATDANNCSATVPYMIAVEPDPIVITATQIVSPKCKGGSDGSITVTAIGGISDGNYTFTLNVENSEQIFSGPAATFEGLPVGLVTITAEAQYECTGTMQFYIPERPDPLSAEISTVSPTCYNWLDGTITIQGNGGDSPYSYSLDGQTFIEAPGGNGPHTFTGLEGDTKYTVFIRDSNYVANHPSYGGCWVSYPVDLIDAEVIDAEFTVTNILCFGEQTGAVSVIASGGTAPYTFSWTKDGSNIVLGTEYEINNLQAGFYEVKITDGHNCDRNFEIEIIQPPLLQMDLVQTNSTCSGKNDGSVVVNIDGGKPPYIYALDGGSPSPNSVFEKLLPGNHSVTATDNNGCNSSSDFIISENEIILSLTEKMDVLCSGNLTGKISLSASGGGTPYQFSINGGTDFFDKSIFAQLPAGNYMAVARDNTKCLSNSIPVTIAEPMQLLADVVTLREASCDLANGIIDISISGGAMPYQQSVLDNNFQENDPLHIASGNYTVRIKDANNCVLEVPIAIQNLDPFEVNYQIIEPAYCGLPNATAKVITTGGFPPFSYLWDNDPARTTSQESNLSGGIHYVEIRNAAGCLVIHQVEIPDNPAFIISDVNKTDATCNQSDGAVEVTPIGGEAPYTFQWDSNAGSQTTPAINNLFAGVYNVLVTDQLGCSVLHAVIINNLNAPVIDDLLITGSYCSNPTGTATLMVSGGTQPYNIEWHGDNYISSGNSVNDLYAGNYYVEITDGTGCITIQPFNIEDDPSFVPQITLAEKRNSACGKAIGSATVQMSGGLAPYMFQWNDPASTAIATAEDLSAGTYEVIGTDARNCVVSFQVVIVDNPDPELNLVEIHPSACGRALGFASVQASGGTPPYSYAWNDGAHQTTPSATHLLYGFYTVTAYDANGCPTNTLNLEVEEIEDLEIIVSEIQNASCFEGSDGMVRVSVVNGVAPFKFSVDGGIEQTDNEFAGLGVGTHFLKVTDANFCTDETEVIIQAPDELRFAGVSKYNPLCFGVCDGEISVLVAGGVGPYNYLWDTSDITKSVTELCPGNYSVTVTDANGCSVSTTIEILQPAKIHGAGIPEKLIICEGNSVEVDAGLWINYEWTGNNFKSFNRKINIHNPGDYYLQVVSPEGCIVLDTVTLELSNEILKAKALVPSKAFIGDTVEVIDVSWPPADNIEWFLPENVNLLEQGDDRILIKFMEAGIYVVGMDATSGLCQDYVEYEIEIMEGEAVDEGGRLGYEAVIESFSLFPNPNNGRFTAIVGLYRNAEITLRVVDNVRSRIIREGDYAGKKEYEIEFSFDDLAGGVYTLNLEVEGEMKNLRFVVN